MWADRLEHRIQITLAASLMVHAGLLSLVSLRPFSRPRQAVMLTDVEYINELASPYFVPKAPKAKPRPVPKEIVGPAQKNETAPAPEEPAPPEEPDNGADAGALPYGTAEDSGRFFLPFYAVEQLPTFQNKIVPVYPESARKLERTSTVILEAYIDAEGAVRKVRVIRSGGGEFDQAAIRALETTHFNPARINGRPVPVWVRVPYVFKLES